MLSKNNMKLNSMRQNKCKQRFALRKLTVGVASVLLGTVVFMGGTAVNADTVSDSNQVNVSQPANTGSEIPASASQSTSAASDATSDAATSDTPASQGTIDDGSTTESGAITDRTSVADPNPHTGEALNFNDGTWKQGNVGNIQNNAIINGQHFTINTNNVSEKSKEEGQFPVWWTQIDGHTYSYQYGSMSTTHKYGGPTLTNPTVYSRKLKSGQTQIARQWDLGNQVTMTELYNVTTDGLMEHLIYVTNNGNNPYEFKDLDWDLDTMLDADDQIPIIADGHGGGYIVGKITLWLQPLYGVSEYSHRWNQPETARTSLTGAKAGETVLNGMDSAIDYQFKADTIAPGKTMVWGFRECLFPEGMNPVQNGIIRATYVDQAGNEVGQAVENFYKIGDHYDTEAKQIHGYHLIKAAENASGQVSFGTTEVTYVYARDEAKIIYQFIDNNENGKVVSSQVVNGFVDQRVDTKLTVPEGYELAQGQQLPSKVQFDNPGMTTTSIHLVHQTEPVPSTDPSLNREIVRTIKINNPVTHEITTEAQSTTLHRNGTKDKVTNKITYGAWGNGSWESYTLPTIAGYVPNQTIRTVLAQTSEATVTNRQNAPVVASQTVTDEISTETVDVNYAPVEQTGKISYVDPEGNEVNHTPLTGNTGEEVTVTPQIPVGWKEVPGQNIPGTVTATADGIPTVTVQVEHATTTVQPTDPKTPADTLPDNPGKKYPSGVAKDDLNRTVTRTINVTKPDGTVTTKVQTSQSTRTATVDEVTGEVTYSQWQNGEWQSYTAPTVAGYTPTQAVVPTVVADANNGDQIIDIRYNPDAQTATVNYIDQDNGNTIVGTQTITGPTDSSYSFVDHKSDLKVPAGYEIVSLPGTYHFKASGNQPVNVILKHKIVSVTDQSQLHREVTRTIKITGLPDGTINDKVQTAKFDRTGTTDLVTGKSTFTPWTPAEQTFEGGYMPHVEGYTIKGSIPEIVVTPSSNSTTVYLHVEKTRDNLTTVQYVLLDDNNRAVKTLKSITKFEVHPTGMPVSYRQYVLNTVTDSEGHVYNLARDVRGVTGFGEINTDGVGIAPKSTFSDDADTTITFFYKEVKPVAPTTYMIEYKVGETVVESKSVPATGFNENAYKRLFIFKNGMHRFNTITNEGNTYIYQYN